MDTVFASEISTIKIGILTKLCSDYNLDFDEIVAKYHDFVPSSTPPKAKKAPVKPKRVEPVHNHKLGETPVEPCMSCLTWGDALLPDERDIFVE